MRLLFLLLIGSLAVGCIRPAYAQTAPSSGFKATVERHLHAVQARDLETLKTTLTTGDTLTLILPNGAVIEDPQTFATLHEEWFADTTWSIAFEPLRFIETEALGTAFLRTTIEDDTPASGRQAYLTLIFAKEEAGWRLVFDQNTRISQE